MSKKIGDFLFIMLILCTVLILMATAGRSEPKPVPTDPPRQTQPEHTAPATTAADPEPDPDPGADPEVFRRVKAVLDARDLDETSISHWVWQPELNPHPDTQGTARASFGRALAQVAAERKMNPIAAFWTLVSQKLYTKTEDTSGTMTADAFEAPDRTAATYAYTREGAAQLITDLLTLAGAMEDGLELEAAILGPDGNIEQLSLAPEEGCRYGYFIVGGERSTHILCFYLRPDKEGEQITDVEFQLLSLRSARGGDDALARLDRRGDTQAAALMAAAELLLTGETQANTGEIAVDRRLGAFTADVERFRFTAEQESGTLTNYRLRKE